uniref:tumor necrosis factor receptor superfamily member 1A-like n=1 Tax=Euleptes europaea TaxID=460621 RepID=UPI00253FD4E3|nr:tumor necrosis factor receptor superfamily member 1A-like [Euleptes europaea]
MLQLGLFPVLAATVKFILIQMNTEECLGRALIHSNVHSHDVLADKQPSIHSGGRERRNEPCRPGYYRHPNQTHCCILCHKGTYVSQHCVSEDKTPDCTPCPKGSFMGQGNSAGKCRSCQNCRSTFKQVILTNCTGTQDTVCGCASNYYRTDDSSEFFCKPCSACHNGTVLKECSTNSDTVCRCNKGFFLQAKKNTCSPCSSCQGEECKEDCDVTNLSISPRDSSNLNPILVSLIVVLGVAFLILAIRSLLKQALRKKLISAFSVCPPKQLPSPANPQAEVQVTNILQESNQEEMLLPATAVPVQPNTPGLPDCIPAAGETPIPDCPAVLYAVVDRVPFSQWKEFVRRLGLSDNDIGRIKVEEWNMRDAQYKMLRHWRLQLGQRATVERMSGVLNEMELSGCSEAIQDVLSQQA